MDENDCLIAPGNYSTGDSHSYPAGFDVGFHRPSRDEVDALRDRLTTDGYKVGRRTEFHMAWTSDIEAPGGFLVEVLHQSGLAEMKAALDEPTTDRLP